MQPQCKAKAKSTGEQCRRYAVKGYAVCQVHGAGSPKKGRPGGVTKTALAKQTATRYAALLPERMLTRYYQSLSDPERLALAEEISLIDARIADLLGRVDTGESGSNWQKARANYEQAEKAAISNDKDLFTWYFRALGECIDAGLSDYAAWAEIDAAIDQRRRLVESERKRLVQMQALVSIQEAMQYIQAFMELAREKIDVQTMTALQEEFIRMAEKTGDKIFD